MIYVGNDSYVANFVIVVWFDDWSVQVISTLG